MKLVWVAALVVSATMAGCSASGGTSADSNSASSGEDAPFELDSEPVAASEVTAIKSYKFDPAVIEVAIGSEVTWTNEDDFPHNVHFLTGVDDTYDLPIGESAVVTFDESGDFYYECSIHPQQMRGQVIVTE